MLRKWSNHRPVERERNNWDCKHSVEWLCLVCANLVLSPTGLQLMEASSLALPLNRLVGSGLSWRPNWSSPRANANVDHKRKAARVASLMGSTVSNRPRSDTSRENCLTLSSATWELAIASIYLSDFGSILSSAKWLSATHHLSRCDGQFKSEMIAEVSCNYTDCRHYSL